MAAAINFYAGETFNIDNLAGSGLGFFGSAGFGDSVAVGSYQDKTYITNGAGTTQGPEADNIKFANAASGYIAGATSGVALTCIPNYQSTLNIRATFDTAVQVQNWRCIIYDRTSISNPASGVTCKIASVIHPTESQTNNGSGSTSWVTAAGTGTYLSLPNSPGDSGIYAGNGTSSAYTSTRHDAYVAITASPNSIGSKTLFGLWSDLEYF